MYDDMLLKKKYIHREKQRNNIFIHSNMYVCSKCKKKLYLPPSDVCPVLYIIHVLTTKTKNRDTFDLLLLIHSTIPPHFFLKLLFWLPYTRAYCLCALPFEGECSEFILRQLFTIVFTALGSNDGKFN